MEFGKLNFLSTSHILQKSIFQKAVGYLSIFYILSCCLTGRFFFKEVDYINQ